ncbi:allophanate hydrolase [Roseivivax halodurans JCM 10272]|uniref:Allophanate hydrolase n=1 Tax=Roseivivax halodurans JCM 10272 TaxID=1449350 RepID=X7EEY9_9RHOB|nr:carboxyltransferase domain-containing protein [Roseivivax halodurans]ETX14487.1 allophanate hydrolase [Roseivivax halodurans JCM 10272]
MTDGFPRIDSAGTDGLLVRFSGALGEPANRAALAYRAALDAEGIEGVAETSTSLVSTFLRLDPGSDPGAVEERARTLLDSRNWTEAPLPAGRRFVRIPTLYGTDRAPQLAAAAEAAGMSAEEAVRQLSQARVRVTTIGFAPGQPYLGTLPEDWDIPRSAELAQVPAAALVVAVRQLVLFANASPTGWRHVGQTGLRLFRPESETPFVLRPGDEVTFPAVDEAEFSRIEGDDDGGADWEDVA